MDYFISDLHWLWMFWGFIVGVFVIMGIRKLVDEIRFKLERRRYQRTQRERAGSTWTKNAREWPGRT